MVNGGWSTLEKSLTSTGKTWMKKTTNSANGTSSLF